VVTICILAPGEQGDLSAPQPGDPAPAPRRQVDVLGPDQLTPSPQELTDRVVHAFEASSGKAREGGRATPTLQVRWW
jgi:hypothetical protein